MKGLTMFHAVIIVCAASFMGEVDSNRCVVFDDAWGPYITEKNCNIRAKQMVDYLKEDSTSLMMASMLGYPPMLYSRGRCIPVEGEAA